MIRVVYVCACHLLYCCKSHGCLTLSLAMACFWAYHIALATFAASTLTFYTFIVVLINFFHNFSLTRHDHLSHTLLVGFFHFHLCTPKNEGNKMHIYCKGCWTHKNWSTFTEWKATGQKNFELNYCNEYTQFRENSVQTKKIMRFQNSLQKCKRILISFPFFPFTLDWFCVWILSITIYEYFFFSHCLWFIFFASPIAHMQRESERW